MDELLGLLCALSVVLAIITVVGHAIWVALRWLFRALFGGTDRSKELQFTVRSKELQFLESRQEAGNPAIGAGASAESSSPPRQASGNLLTASRALDGLLWQLDTLRDNRQLSEESWRRLRDFVREEQARILKPAELVSAEVVPETIGTAATLKPPPASEVRVPHPVPGLSVAERARTFEARQAAHATEAAAAASASAATTPRDSSQPASPAKPWSEWLASFLEEKNIRWGELAGGLLIVCCSIALVLSFWARIAESPFLKFFVFNGATAAVFGAGYYTLRRWKLPTTSHGLFIIATLLVPLNFLAIAAITQDVSQIDAFTLAGEGVTMALFFGLLYVAARDIAADRPWALLVGVLGSAVSTLLVRRFVDPEASTAVVLSMAALPLCCYWIATAWAYVRLRSHDTLEEPQAIHLFTLLGLSTFAAILPLGMLLFKAGQAAEALRQISPVASLLGGPLVAAGLLVWRRMARPQLAAWRTAGTSLAVIGALVLLLGLMFAWPDPARIVPLAMIDFVLFTAVALMFGIPAAHVVAAVCLALAWLVALPLLTGNVGLSATYSEIGRAILSARSGTALLPVAVLYAAASVLLSRWRRPQDAQFHALSAGLAALASLALASWFGFGVRGDPHGVMWVYLAYSVGALAAAYRAAWAGQFVVPPLGGEPIVGSSAGLPPEGGTTNGVNGETHLTRQRVEQLAWIGSVLLLAALVQGLVYKFAEPWNLAHPWLTAALAHASITIVLASQLGYRLQPAGSSNRLKSGLQQLADLGSDAGGGRLARSLTHTAQVISLAALAIVVWLVPREAPGFLSAHCLWLGGIWLAMAWSSRSPARFSAFQATLAGSTVFAVGAWLSSQAWWSASARPWLDPWTLQAIGIALGLLSLAWVVIRISVRAGLDHEGGAPDTAGSNGGSVPESSGPALAAEAGPTLRLNLDRLLNPAWPAVDRALSWVVLLGLTAIAVYGALPGAAQELTPRSVAAKGATVATTASSTSGAGTAASGRVVPAASRFEWWHVPHEHALQAGSWILLGVVLLVLLFSQWDHFDPRQVLGMIVALSAVCPLVAGRFEPDVAVASALRWSTALFLAIASLAVWTRGTMAHFARRLNWPQFEDRSARLGSEACGLALFLAAAPIVAMAAYVSLAAVGARPPDAAAANAFVTTSVVFVVLAAVALLLRSIPAAGLAWFRQSATLLFLLGIGPLVAVSLYVVSMALRGNPIVGPEPGSLFARMGLAASYASPVLLIAATLVGYALRERSSGFALSAGLLFNLGATGAYLLTVAKGGIQLDALLWTKLAQLNTWVSAGFALAWIAAVVAWSRRRHVPPQIDGLLATQTSLGLALCTIVLLPAAAWLVFDPATVTAAQQQAGGLWGWSSVALALAAAAALGRLSKWRFEPGSFAMLLLGGGSLIALTATRWDQGDWLAYHTLLAAVAVVAAATLAVSWSKTLFADPAQRPSISRWTTGLVALCVVLALRAVEDDPQAPWWSIGAIVAMGLLSAAQACFAERRRMIYRAGALFNLAVTIWWFSNLSWPGWGAVGTSLVDLVELNIIVLALPCVAWVLLELRVFAKRADAASMPARGLHVGFHRPAAFLSLLALMGLVALGLLVDLLAGPDTIARDVFRPWLGWTALGATAIALAACLWDATAKASVAGLYVLGLTAVGMALDHFNLAPRWIVWTGAMLLAAYCLATSYLWSRRRGLLAWAEMLRIPRDVNAPFAGLAWLAPVNCLMAATVVALAFGIQLSFAELPLRLAVAKAALFQAVSIGLLARGERRTGLQYGSLAIGVLGAVALGWAWLTPGTTGTLLNRAVVTTAALAATTVLYGLGFAKLLPAASEWARAARRLVPSLVLLACVSVLFVLSIEVSMQLQTGSVAMDPPAIAAIIVALVGVALACIAAAVLPGRDPLSLSERGRTTYIYAAEVVLALLCLHVRLTMPWLFSGFITRYWPFIVMLIAFVGVGLSEFFRRKQNRVLAEPLENTGAFLPLLPVIGFFAIEVRGHYSILLLSVSMLYAALAITRKSFVYGVLAALAANGGLWYLLGKVDGLALWEHPQLWLIPPALCVLAAAWLNRDRLTQEQMTTIRYLTSMTIYVSSTADVFINGVAQAPWLPLVLAGLSVAGIFAGILMRVRAFLFLGMSFLVLALLTMVWHAAHDLQQTWVWSATGIVAGVLIIVLFATFEKKRTEVLRLVDQLKEWDA